MDNDTLARIWFKENKTKFHQTQWSDEDIASEAFNEGYKLAVEKVAIALKESRYWMFESSEDGTRNTLSYEVVQTYLNMIEKSLK